MKKLFYFFCSIFLPLSLASAASASSPCTNLTTSLTKGSNNMQVLKLQQFLFAENYSKIQPSGFFGTDTVKAVKSFQKANGITQVGSAGSLTRKKIKELTCSNSSIKVDKISLSTPAGRQALYDILLQKMQKLF